MALFTTACTANTPAGSKPFVSVRERLADAPTQLFIGTAESTGTVTARRWTPGGWIEGDHTLTIESGAIEASVDASGKLSIEAFEVSLAPLDIPEEVFKKPAQLSDVKIKLVEPLAAEASWSSENEATARLQLALDLEWAITVNGGRTPLGEQQLPPVDVDLTLSGDGDVVGATITLAATGELWNWAGLLQMTRLELDMSASTPN